MITSSVILPYIGNDASIPTRWQRETALDAKYPKVSSVVANANTTGGSTTHTHTATSHTHTMDAHTHSVSLAASVQSASSTGSDNDGASASHSHTTGGVTGAVSGGSISSAIGTYGAVSNDPPYYEVIYIKPTVTVYSLPLNVICYLDDAGFVNNTNKYSGFYQCDGNNSTPNLTDKYLKGASGGANSGGTGGGTTNTHAMIHSHTQSHAHVSVSTTGVSGNANADVTSGSGAYEIVSHTHTVSFNANTTALDDAPTVLQAETVEVAYKKLLAIQNKVADARPILGMIGLTLSTTIPTGWAYCNGDNGTPDIRGKYIKVTNTVGDIGDTGGSNTHSHAGATHSHTFNHLHTAQTTAPTNRPNAGGSGFSNTANHIHPVTIGLTSPTISSESTTGDSQSNEPEYVYANYIKLIAMTDGAFLLNFL